VVTVWVMGVDHERKRVSLTMVKPGTERPRGQQAGGRRGGGPGGEPRDGQPGQGRRGGGRGPRPITSALTAPPVGAPSVAVLPEAPPRRNDRDRPGPGGGRSSDPRSQAPPHGGSPHQEFRGGPPRLGGSGQAPGRDGPRGPYPPQNPNVGRPPRLDRGPADRPQNRPPRRPSAPPPPLSKEALEGNVPLRTFGQLKQLWEARTDEPEDSMPGSEAPAPRTSPAPAEATAPPADTPESADTARLARDESEPPALDESGNQTASNSS
jgi:protein Tex